MKIEVFHTHKHNGLLRGVRVAQGSVQHAPAMRTVATEGHMFTMARLATVLMAKKRRDDRHRREMDPLDVAAINHVLELSSTGPQGHSLELVLSKVTEAVATEHSVAQLHGIGLPGSQGNPSISGEPLVGPTPQGTGNPGQVSRRMRAQMVTLRSQPLHQVEQHLALVPALDVGQRSVQRQRLQGLLPRLTGLLLANSSRREVQIPVPVGKIKSTIIIMATSLNVFDSKSSNYILDVHTNHK